MSFNINIEKSGLVLFLLLGVLPLVLGIGYALLYSLGLTGVLSHGFTLNYWSRAMADREIWTSLLFSLYIAAVSMTFSISLAIGLTLRIRNSVEQGRLPSIMYFPLAIPAIVAAFFVFQVFAQSGFLSRIFYQLGITPGINSFPDIVNDAYGVGIILTHTLMATPFLLIYFLNIYKNEKIEELARLSETLGAGKLYAAFKVTIPIIITRSLPTLVLYFIFVLGSYEIPLILGRESPQMISVLAIRKLRKYNLSDIPEAYIIAMIYILIVLAFIILFFRKRRLHYDL